MQMPVQFNEPKRNYLLHKIAIDDAISHVLESGNYIFGPEVERFEQRFAEYCGTSHCVGVASGTDGLTIALRAAGVTAGNEVITVANAGGYSTIACMQVGAVPVFVDAKEYDLTLDPAQIAPAISEKTRAIIVTHLFGNMADIESVEKIARQRNIVLIEDCAQAHGALLDGKRAGSFGQLGVFSFYPTKNLGALGDGGAIVCSSHRLAESLQQLRQYGWDKKYSVRRPYGSNSRLDPIQASVLSAKLPQLDQCNRRRREIVRTYMRRLDSLVTFCHQLDESYAGHLCVVRHPQRDYIRKRLAEAGIGTEIHYPVLDFDQPGLQEMNFRTRETPVSERVLDEIFSLPVYPELRDGEVDEVCQNVINVCDSISS